MEELKRLRKAKGLSQAKLAARADLDPSTVSQIETGIRRANSRTLERLAGALGVEVRDLFPLGQAPLPDFEGEWRKSEPPEAADSDPYRWVRGKATEDLQQMALEEARFAKPQTVEELLEGHRTDKKAQLEAAHRRTMAWTNIGAINAELARRGARSPVELAIKHYDEAMNPPAETPQEARGEQEGKKAG